MNGWHVYGMLDSKSCDFQCIADNIYDALKKAEEYGLKDIDQIFMSSTKYEIIKGE